MLRARRKSTYRSRDCGVAAASSLIEGVACAATAMVFLLPTMSVRSSKEGGSAGRRGRPQLDTATPHFLLGTSGNERWVVGTWADVQPNQRGHRAARPGGRRSRALSP